jgi:putative ABC transport system permease protein
MAMALLLLVGAGLMCRTLVQLWKIDPGFEPRNVSYFDVTPSPSLVKQSPDAIRAALRQIKATIQNVDGAETASLNAGANPMQWDSERGFCWKGRRYPRRRPTMFLRLWSTRLNQSISKPCGFRSFAAAF